MANDIKDMLSQILTAVKGLERRVATLEAGTSTNAVAGTEKVPSRKPISIKEFIISKAPSNGILMTLTVGYFLENHGNVSPFTAADLEAGFRSAREAVPPNVNDKANNCVKRGYFMEAKEKKDNLKAWVLTSTGERLVEEGFS